MSHRAAVPAPPAAAAATRALTFREAYSPEVRALATSLRESRDIEKLDPEIARLIIAANELDDDVVLARECLKTAMDDPELAAESANALARLHDTRAKIAASIAAEKHRAQRVLQERSEFYERAAVQQFLEAAKKGMLDTLQGCLTFLREHAPDAPQADVDLWYKQQVTTLGTVMRSAVEQMRR